MPPDELGRALRTLASSARTAVLVARRRSRRAQTALRGPLELRDAESGRSFETTLDEQAAADYAERFAGSARRSASMCREAGVRYVQARSDAEPLDALLAHATTSALTVG